ncbi:aminodeoxychorismate synthase component I [Pseudoduganella sp. DS3]|uniref:Aminodeoxychorismate synthase component I n=1 Tax=Pseudoduganella guangdongensis TaxID=2692179 RepID=A0A6N9HDW1_9BURK|nr:aminodeoxychorismate synthase component I [Pseudoduganella guangdongensis]MYN01233.1 aminodeoxychorismate synthase component I [Pseudoduganella guangdongensis]
MNCLTFALLDDASVDPATGAGRPSRLYTGHQATLACRDFAGWPGVLADMQAALARGLHAVPVLSYELGHHIVGVPPRAPDAGAPPLAQVLLFGRCDELTQAEVADWLAARAADATPGNDAAASLAGVANIRANVSEAQFVDAIQRIRAYIAAGDTYQVNYTYRLHFDAFGSLFALYQRLRARQPVPYGALIGFADGRGVLSLSPELFVRKEGELLTARPMKGTASAAADDGENARRAAALAADPKNRAENLMIVDLLRNDIGRIAATGSVEVPKLFEVTRFSSVLQMTSTVQARLRPDATLREIFDALYPCGSITGAPKKRTMEIIAELEPEARGIYTGAIGWFAPDGDFCLNVPIRTLTLQAPHNGVRQGVMGVGAGIVHDSEAHDEFAECQLKARFLTGLSNDFELFETMHATRESGPRHLERHLQRLAASARYFGFAWNEAAARAYLTLACQALPPGQPHRLRLAMNSAGAFAVQSGVLAPLQEPVRVLLAEDATDSRDLFLRHKSTLRERYDAAWKAADAQGAFDQLFFNERGELTEGGRSNVFIRRDGVWITPPLSSGMLPGVMRAVILDAWGAQERPITREMLLAAQEIVVCNSLRGAMRASLHID